MELIARIHTRCVSHWFCLRINCNLLNTRRVGMSILAHSLVRPLCSLFDLIWLSFLYRWFWNMDWGVWIPAGDGTGTVQLKQIRESVKTTFVYIWIAIFLTIVTFPIKWASCRNEVRPDLLTCAHRSRKILNGPCKLNMHAKMHAAFCPKARNGANAMYCYSIVEPTHWVLLKKSHYI